MPSALQPLSLQLPALVSLLISAGKTQTAVITPLSYTARLGSVGAFHCAATRHHVISWYVNGVPSTYFVIRNRQITATDETPINATWSQSSLTIYASQDNNGLSIHCAAVVLGGPDGFSETATFHVQGYPLPPTNLTIKVLRDFRYLMLQWNPPSEIISNTSVIIYTVYVNISGTGSKIYVNSTTREYMIENPCTDVLFKVTAWDKIGEGNGTTLLHKHNTTDMIVIRTMATVNFAASGEPNVQLTFQIQNICFHGPPIFLVETWSDCSGSTHHQGPLMLESTIVNSTVTLVIPHLLPNCHITARVQNQKKLSNLQSSRKLNVTFATYDVQDAEISEGTLTNSICITCIFAQGTSSQGCYISLLAYHDSSSMAINNSSLRIEREGDSLNVTGCIENLERGLYHVVAYDIEADGTIDWHNRAFFPTAALNMTSSPEQLAILDNPVFVIAGGTGGGALVLLLVVTAVILLCILFLRKVHSTTHNSKQTNHDDTDDIEMKQNEIYGQLPQQQIVRNPAYNWWHPRGS